MSFKETYIGCSGFHYKDWKEKFYPKHIPQRLWLEYYAEEFNTLELNNTFYRLPKKTTMENWYKRTPGHFRFTVKGSRYISHIKRLKDAGDAVKNFYDAISPLKEKADCVLWQLPPSLKKDLEALKNFVRQCSKGFYNVIEFRHPSWFDDEAYELLEKEKMVYCALSAPNDLPDDVVQTNSEAVYIRFHGKTDWYHYYYSDNELRAWKEKLDAAKAKKLYAYFNNDFDANAVFNAMTFNELFELEEIAK